ncbi:MAG: DUF5709 domain-containing protein [Bifidobacteriaceae bacterium]|jgi:hypothetical protein|nr:DUF5709 domain-containing protein [Bifidobacteriaceae bacterium]
MDSLTSAPADPPFDTGQNTAEDLLTPGDLDPLDTGYDPPDYEPLAMRRLIRQGDHESLTERLDDEEPEIWDQSEELADTSRTGRLVATESGSIQDIFAQDAGLDGLASSAEEAAIHYED